MQKKKILFVMNNLGIGGAEKALISMLQVFDYTSYEVDLLLFKQEGLFLKQIPAEVNLLPEPENWKYFDMPFSEVVKEIFFRGKWHVIIQRIIFKAAQIKAKSAAEKEQFGWKTLSKTIKPLNKKYDVAIGFLQNNPNYFVVDKVNAERKFGYIHNDYEKLGMNRYFDNYYFNKLNYIISVSKANLNVLRNNFPQESSKFIEIQNISAQNLILKLAEEPITEIFKANSIVSVGRLVAQKNYSLTINALEILAKRKVAFHWYVLGEGHLYSELSEQIKRCGISGSVTFLGVCENPYPYIKKADVFVMSSIFEGDGIAVREAKILQKPIVLTNFNTAGLHIINGVNGFIVENNPMILADTIEKLLGDDSLRNYFAENLGIKDLSNITEIEKLYQLFEE